MTGRGEDEPQAGSAAWQETDVRRTSCGDGVSDRRMPANLKRKEERRAELKGERLHAAGCEVASARASGMTLLDFSSASSRRVR